MMSTRQWVCPTIGGMPRWIFMIGQILLAASAMDARAQDQFVTLPCHLNRRLRSEDNHSCYGPPWGLLRKSTRSDARGIPEDSWRKSVGPQRREAPVHNVSWWDAIRYCNLRSIAENLEPCYNLQTGACDRRKNGYRLLTDAEWQYAAGKLPEPANAASFANLGPADTKDTGPLVAYARANGPKIVGSLASNEHGLYDMLGNVWEWVQDYQDPSGAVSATVNPSGPTIGVARVIRGGSYLTTTSRWGRNYRSSLEPERKSPYTGFRVCRSIVEPPSSTKTLASAGSTHTANPLQRSPMRRVVFFAGPARLWT